MPLGTSETQALPCSPAGDFSAVTIHDDGVGMAPFEFRYDFTRIGGSSRRVASAPTRKGRPRIGSKGIGFLALARYCDVMEVQSSRNSNFRYRFRVPKTPANVDLSAILGVPLSRDLLGKRLRVKLRGPINNKRKLRAGVHYKLTAHGTRLLVRKDLGPVRVDLSVDCRNLGFTATLDFHRLLRLADTADLEKLEDFATIQVHEATDPPIPGTRIVARALKEFVRRELRAERRKGFVRNVASLRGLERFNWHLSRCTPVRYSAPDDSVGRCIRKLLGHHPSRLPRGSCGDSPETALETPEFSDQRPRLDTRFRLGHPCPNRGHGCCPVQTSLRTRSHRLRAEPYRG